MKYTLLLLAISYVATQDVTNCATSASGTSCVTCDGTNCTKCYKGFVSSNQCAALNSANTGCIVGGDSATKCAVCDPSTHFMFGDVCIANPTNGGTVTGWMDKCIYYTGTSATAAKCYACSTKPTANTATVASETVDVSCSATAIDVSNCKAQGQISTATPENTFPCRLCNPGYTLIAADNTCANTSVVAGCAKGTSGASPTCEWCELGTYAMKKANVCTKIATGYSAILSVVSMIVALMFANF
jgi:hypothetical protein